MASSTNQILDPLYTSVDGLSIRYADTDPRDVHRPVAVLLSPWPESVFAFDRIWTTLQRHARLIAVDPPGFGKSEYREALMNPRSMGEFILDLVDAFALENPHIVAPDIGTSSALFAAASRPGAFASVVVGSGGAAVPLDLAGPLAEWVEAPDLQPYRDIGGRHIVDLVLSTIQDYTPPEEIAEDYRSAYDGDRFAATIPYAQAYKEQLPVLGELLTDILTPVRIVQGNEDGVVPAANAVFLHQRLPNSQLNLIDGAGHFCWEERPEDYARLVWQWWESATQVKG